MKPDAISEISFGSNSGSSGEEGDDDDELVHGQRKRKVAFMPSVGEYFDYQVVQYELFLHVCYEGTTHTIYYRGHWLRVR